MINHSVKQIAFLLSVSLSTLLLYFWCGVPSAGSDTFLPTWRLLSVEQKQQFISGYLFGWRDAARITRIAAEYVRENPQKGLESLENIQSLYHFSDIKPAVMVSAIDTFYAEPKNNNASLFMAITAAQRSISQ